MKVKELIRKYASKGYSIELFGKPLDIKTTPYSYLPASMRELNDYVVEQMEIIDQPQVATQINIRLFGGEPGVKSKKITKVGKVKAYVKKG